MKLFKRYLVARLVLAFLALFVLIGFAFLMLANWSNNRYYEEVTQNLNQSLAMYIAQREPLISQGVVNAQAMKTLAELVMVVNPIVEVYLLDSQGFILTHALADHELVLKRVALEPIQHYLNKSQHTPIVGNDPRSAFHQKVFSVFPVMDGDQQAGYLYVVLGGQAFQSLAESIRGSYIVQLSVAALLAIIIFAVIGAAVIFMALTRPLRQLALSMNEFQQQELKNAMGAQPDEDEIVYLQRSFESMRERIRDQLQKLQETDQMRRELISNVSHDLRTPLASMQGYLEMLLLPSIANQERTQYISIAFKHCRRLTQLVKELFELSKLDAGRTQPQCEQFSLAELLQDIAQKFMLKAEKKSIRLTTPQNSPLFMVTADIALIERVLENLIDNALRYTPEGGCVNLSVTHVNESVEVKVEDTGIGLAQADLPYIFERYYRAKMPHQINTQENDQGTGLGLAIVKRILELHGSVIRVESQPNKGSCFSFPLPGVKRVA